MRYCRAPRSNYCTRRGADLTVFSAASLDPRPSWRAKLSAIDVQKELLTFIEAARAKRVEQKAARLQNAAFTCERPSPKARGARCRAEREGGEM